jgi:hypothetical protein
MVKEEAWMRGVRSTRRRAGWKSILGESKMA